MKKGETNEFAHPHRDNNITKIKTIQSRHQDKLQSFSLNNSKKQHISSSTERSIKQIKNILFSFQIFSSSGLKNFDHTPILGYHIVNKKETKIDS